MLRWADPWKVVINIEGGNKYWLLQLQLHFGSHLGLICLNWQRFNWIFITLPTLFNGLYWSKKTKKKRKKSTKANDSGTITISFYVLNFSTQLLSKKTVKLLQLELWLFNGGETMRMALLILPQRPHTFSRLLCLKFFKKES